MWPLLEQTLFLVGTGEGVQHTVAAIQKSQQRLGRLKEEGGKGRNVLGAHMVSSCDEDRNGVFL